MADLKLDPLTGDLDLSSNGLEIVTGDDALTQHLAIRLRFFKNEWFLDTRLGVPYFDEILVKNPDLVAIRSIFREVILETPGIVSIERFDLSVDAALRKLSVEFSVGKTEGGTLDFSREFLIGD